MSAPRHHQVLLDRGGESFSDNARWLHDSDTADEMSPEMESLREMIESARRNLQRKDEK